MAKRRRAGSAGAGAKARSAGSAQAAAGPRVPWWAPGAVFVLATLALFGEFVFSDRMLYGEDSLSLGYMARAYFAERLAYILAAEKLRRILGRALNSEFYQTRDQ